MSDYPKEWASIALAQLVDVIDPHPSHRAPEAVEFGIPFFGIGDINEDGSYKLGKVRIVAASTFDEHVKRYKVSANTLGFGRVATVGKVIDFKQPTMKFAVSPTMAIMEPNGSAWRDFVYYALNSEFISEQIQKLLTGSTRSSLGIELLRQLHIYCPTMKEQQRIAKILRTADNLIDKTQALIDKYKAVKQGMMTDLFTRGIDLSGCANTNPNYGQLRPSFVEAPALYEETELGLVPKGWVVNTLESLLSDIPAAMRSGPFGSALLKHELVDDGIPLLGIDNIFVERFKTKFRRYVTTAKFQELAKYAVRPADVIITIMGTVGRCCVVPQNVGRALSSKHLWTMTFDQQRVLPELVCWQLNYAPWAKSWFASKSQGGIMEAIQSQTLKTLLLPTPPLLEQVKILKIYQNLQGKLTSEQALLNKLRLQKKGLMQDLLTGKVRVN